MISLSIRCHTCKCDVRHSSSQRSILQASKFNERSVQPVEQNVHERTGSKGLFPNFGVPPMASSKGAAYHFSDLIV